MDTGETDRRDIRSTSRGECIRSLGIKMKSEECLKGTSNTGPSNYKVILHAE